MVTGFVDRAKGKTIISTQYQSAGGAFFASFKDSLTATASGTQTNSILLTEQISRFATVASGAACLLPPAQPGAVVTIINDGLNTLGIFPASQTQGGASGGDKINANAQNAKDTTVATAGSVTILYGCSGGVWRTK